MICGIFEKGNNIESAESHIHSMCRGVTDRNLLRFDSCGSVIVGYLVPGLYRKYSSKPAAMNKVSGPLCIAWQGEIHNRAELAHTLKLEEISPDDRILFLYLYQAFGHSCVEKINGNFSFAVYDSGQQTLVLGRDRFGICPLFYYEDSKRVIFSSRLAPILAHPDCQKKLNPRAYRRYLAFNYNPSFDTFFDGVKKVRPGYLAIAGRLGTVEKRYWFLSFDQTRTRSIDEHCDTIRDLMRDSIRLRTQNSQPPGIFLSGGMDSSSIAGLTREVIDQPISTFSYRCLGDSVDESGYARIMAKHCDAEHHEIVYAPSDVCQIESVVALMDEPFCDAGINIATILLGQLAQGKVSAVFSGDGGDELFGGHPVYGADKISAVFEIFPLVVRSSITALLKKLPDTDKKNNLTVKLKRFSEGLDYPQQLGTHRWRVFYSDDDIDQLLSSDLTIGQVQSESVFTDVIKLTGEADGPDILSRSLYGDFQTVLGFSLRRMGLLRNFDIHPYFPLLDHRLAEYVASIPSGLKIQGISDTKFIQKKAMQGILPDKIVFRKDKMGHSIPLKIWLREERVVQEMIQDVLSPMTLKNRGINEQFVQSLLHNHQTARQNNSHRLWGLTVLMLWMNANHL